MAIKLQLLYMYLLPFPTLREMASSIRFHSYQSKGKRSRRFHSTMRLSKYLLQAIGALTLGSKLTGAAYAASDNQLRGQHGHAPPPHELQLQTRRLKKPTTSTTCEFTSIVEVEYEDPAPDQEDSYISCVTSNGKSYKVKGVPAEVVRANKKSIIDGMSDIDLPEGSILDESTGTIELPPGKRLGFKESSNHRGNHGNGRNNGNNSPPQEGRAHDNAFFNRRNRKLSVTGTRSVLVVRVIAADSQTTASELRLSDSVFGNGVDGSVDTVTLRSQYLACSYDQLNFVQAADRDGNSINIRNGTFMIMIHVCIFINEIITKKIIRYNSYQIINLSHINRCFLYFLKHVNNLYISRSHNRNCTKFNN